jgi:hypothetical protein
MIFDRRSVSADETTLYSVSSYRESHRSHTKHTLIYTHVSGKEREERTKYTKIRTMRRMKGLDRSNTIIKRTQTGSLQDVLLFDGRHTSLSMNEHLDFFLSSFSLDKSSK